MHQMLWLLSDRFVGLNVKEPIKPSDQSQWFSAVTAYQKSHSRSHGRVEAS
jgi:hypothetical protein